MIRSRVVIGLALTLAAVVLAPPAAHADVDLLSQANIRLDGAAANDQAGRSVAGAGDVNNDGRADVIVGALNAANNGRSLSGSAYVVFGQTTSTGVDLLALGSAGFRIDGAATGDQAGRSVAGAGDINTDGRADVIVGAISADNNGRSASGSAYVVFGKTTSTTVDLAALGSAGFRIDGAATGDIAGYSVAGAGDINADGRPDVLVGAPGADNNGRGTSGSAYVVFGKTTITSVDLLALGSNGFRIDGAATNDLAGVSVAGAGDVNDDGRADVIVGADFVGNNGRSGSGSAYVVFGKTTSTTVDLLALGSAGFRIDGAAANDRAGSSVAGAGDVNADGRADVIVGALGADNNARSDSGSAYVVFGKTTSTSVDLAALGSNGFRIDGAATGEQVAFSVAGAGDINADGRPDVIVGAPFADHNARGFSGSAYVVFGKTTITSVDLAALGSNGFRIDGAATSDNAGYSVAGAGDVNGDVRPDVIVGARTADNNARTNSGSAYVVLGAGQSLPAVVRSSTSWFLGGALDGSCCVAAFTYGARPLVPLMGDWDGNGSRTAGTFEGGVFKLRNANSAGAADITFTFGDPRGFPVSGDFDGNGTDDVAVFRKGTWQLRLSNGTVLAPFTWGSGSWPATVPLTGDWDRNGSDGIGTYTHTSAQWNLRNAADGNGGGDAGSFVHGTPNSSYPVIGDWNGDGIDTVGHKTGQTWTLTNSNTTRSTDITPFDFGLATVDLPLSWRAAPTP